MAQKNVGPKGGSRQDAPKQRPAGEIRYGRLRATIWKQESDKGPWYSVVLTRSYQDAQGDWHTSSSFGRDDLLLLAKLCDQAHSWIHRQLAKDASSTNAPEGDGAQAPPTEEIPF